MPSAGYPVKIPDELKGIRPEDEPPPGWHLSPAFVRAVLALLCIVSGAVMLGVGVGTWLRPAAGLAAVGVYVGAFGFALAFTDDKTE